jgi:hypothetical protein
MKRGRNTGRCKERRKWTNVKRMEERKERKKTEGIIKQERKKKS